MGTLLIAEEIDSLVKALNFTININFQIADGLVDPFETIIRYALKELK